MKGGWRSFVLALQFLTRIPVRSASTEDADVVRSVFWYPYVGLVLGVLYALLAELAFALFPAPIAAFCMLAATVALTGALHLDGLMDTADGLLSGRTRERMLDIMRDSRVGAMGAVALVLLLLGKWVCFAELGASSPWVWLLMPAFGRYAIVLLLAGFPYARAEGMGKVFAGKIGWLHAIASGLFLPLPLILWRGEGVALVLLFFVTVWILGRNWAHKLGGLTGDTYGAMCELQELIFLLGMVVLQPWK